jgi:hypothetical protein
VIDDREPRSDADRWGLVAAILRIGTLVAVAALGSGLGWAILADPPPVADLTVLELMARGGPDAVIGLGLLALTLVPIAALAAAAYVFQRLGESRSLLVTIAVLVLLVASVIASAAIGATS